MSLTKKIKQQIKLLVSNGHKFEGFAHRQHRKNRKKVSYKKNKIQELKKKEMEEKIKHKKYD